MVLTFILVGVILTKGFTTVFRKNRNYQVVDGRPATVMRRCRRRRRRHRRRRRCRRRRRHRRRRRCRRRQHAAANDGSIAADDDDEAHVLPLDHPRLVARGFRTVQLRPSFLRAPDLRMAPPRPLPRPPPRPPAPPRPPPPPPPPPQRWRCDRGRSGGAPQPRPSCRSTARRSDSRRARTPDGRGGARRRRRAAPSLGGGRPRAKRSPSDAARGVDLAAMAAAASRAISAARRRAGHSTPPRCAPTTPTTRSTASSSTRAPMTRTSTRRDRWVLPHARLRRRRRPRLAARCDRRRAFTADP